MEIINKLDEFVNKSYGFIYDGDYPKYKSIILGGMLCSNFEIAYKESSMFSEILNRDSKKKIKKIKKSLIKKDNIDDNLVFVFYAESFLLKNRNNSSSDYIVAFREKNIEVYHYRFFSLKSNIILYEKIDKITLNIVKGISTHTAVTIYMKSGVKHIILTQVKLIKFINLKLLAASRLDQFNVKIINSEPALDTINSIFEFISI